MRQIFDFVKTTALGGAIFLLPFAAMLIVVVKAGKMAVDSVTPLAEKLPEVIIAVYVGGALLLVLVAFAAGLLTRSLRGCFTDVGNPVGNFAAAVSGAGILQLVRKPCGGLYQGRF